MSRDLIDRQTVVDALDHVISHGAKSNVGECHFLSAEGVKEYVLSLPSAQPDLQPTCNQLATDCISRKAAIDALKICDNNEDGINCHKCPLRDERWDGAWQDDETNCYTKLMRDSAKLLELPSAQPERASCKQVTGKLDLISRQDAIIAVRSHRIDINDPKKIVRKSYEDVIRELPSAQPEQPTEIQDILTYLDEKVHPIVAPDNWNIYSELRDMISELSAQPEQINPCTICQEFDCYGCKFRRTT